ncbi:hypothetical protein E4099_30750 [Streptomyces palmae]|uniref:Uncharacterized protein n=2 Tax=Streptomyces palmae TaxID=1701085 RepID=A0A4Z0FW51_9ACTN|nr:hypothetical protein E4099_30750 [Streptomyces palmae]
MPGTPGDPGAPDAMAPEAAPAGPDAYSPMSEGVQIAHEVAVTIGEAVVSHLPDVHGAAAQRGLDIRWMRLKINIPGFVLGLMVVWSGNSLISAMAQTVKESGPFGLLGWLLVPAVMVGLVMVTPVGGSLGRALIAALQPILGGIGRLLARGWHVRGVGYVLRVAVAMAVWSLTIAILAVVGRALIHLLTGA